MKTHQSPTSKLSAGTLIAGLVELFPQKHPRNKRNSAPEIAIEIGVTYDFSIRPHEALPFIVMIEALNKLLNLVLIVMVIRDEHFLRV